MTETTENLTAPTHPAPEPHRHRPNRVYQAAAWVAIVAGVVFIVGAVFFTGFALGRHSGGGPGGWNHHRGGPMMLQRGGPMMDRDDMRPGMMAPGGPDREGPGVPPAPPSASPTPAAPR